MNSKPDPDSNFLTPHSLLLSNCMHLTTTEFNKKNFQPSDVHLHFTGINIYSLTNHYDDLSEYFSSLNVPFSVVAVSEAWLHTMYAYIFQMPGYKFVA